MSGVGYWSRARAWMFYHSGGLRHRHMVVTAPPLFWGSSEQRGFVHHWGGLRHRRMAVTGVPPFFWVGRGKGGRVLAFMGWALAKATASDEWACKWMGGWVGGRVGGLMSEGGGVGRWVCGLVGG